MDINLLLAIVQSAHPTITFQPADTYYWSPENRTVNFKKNDKDEHGVWSLLHECGHALLDHTKYYSDFELVRMEMEAWEKAKELAAELQEAGRSEEKGVAAEPQKNKQKLFNANTGHRGDKIATQLLPPPYPLLPISEDHIQDCLDSYRDWLHKRSLCPDCRLSSIQTDAHTYTCVFCHKKWRVTAERFCRPYRRKLGQNITTP